MKKVILSIEGMTCSACSNGLEKYLNKQNGIKNASVNLVMANATILYDESILTKEDLDKFILKSGFKSLGEFKTINLEKKSNKKRINFIIFTILACVFMYISMGHMINLPSLPYISIDANLKGFTICQLLFAIVFMIYGYDILKNGYKNLIHMLPNMDTLVGIGVISSFGFSLYNMILLFNGNSLAIHNLYFDSVVMVIYFIKLGRYIDSISKDKTKEAIGKLVSITPKYAVIRIDGEEKKVTIDEVKKGDIVISKPGEKIAVDGVIIEGCTHVDESFITGESKAVSKKPNDRVIAGSINYDGYIEFKAERIGKDSTISEVVKLVIEASNTKSPLSRIADKVSRYFVPTVIALSILSFFFYLILGYSFSEALTTFVTILVVACPCSLGLATPLAIVVSEGKCASKGILIKKSEILENAEKVNTVVFDKTGTLTYGKLKISKMINLSKKTDKEILTLACSLESKSSHPISDAFKDYREQHNLVLKNVLEFESINGYGIKGKIDNKEIVIGNAKLLSKNNITNKYIKKETEIAVNGNSVIYIAIEKEIVCLLGVNDIVRNNSSVVIKNLNNNNIQTIMLTGDNENTAKNIAKSIGINKVIANVLPNEKTNVVKNLKENGNYVMMCGDGINDSPALATANIGVSIKSGTDIANDSADVILMGNDLNCIVELINISKKTVKIIKQNLFWAFFYNALMIPIAAGLFKFINIEINPMIASLAMVLSSITVILNTLRLKNK